MVVDRNSAPNIAPRSGRVPDTMHAHQQSDEPDDEIIYLGTVIRRYPLETASCRDGTGGLSQNTNTRASTSNHRVPLRSNRTPRRGATSTPPRPRTRHRRKSSRRQTKIPSSMVDRLVKLGCLRSSESGERRAVYGSFNRADRFCYWLDAGKSVPVAQKNVDYVPRFRGMTRQRVKAAVYKILDGWFTDAGEV